jgi:nucleoside-diphosphate-sugar epimerase
MSELHVIFGTGPLGKWTARELVKLGKQVRMVNHSGKASGLPTQIEIVASDAYDVNGNIEVTRGSYAIYQCAQPHYYEWREKFPALQKAILDAAVANKARLIVGDNLYMYGDTRGQLICEELPYLAHTRKGRLRAEMATAILEAHSSGKVRAAIGRASNFFGPDDHAVTDYAIRPAVEGKTVNMMGRMDQLHTFTYVADFGKLLATLGTHDESLGQVWFAPSPEPVTQAEIVYLLEEEVGHKLKVMVGGEMTMRLLGLFNPDIRETVEMMYEWTQPFIVDTNKAVKAFGLAPTPLKQAIHATVEWCRASMN